MGIIDGGVGHALSNWVIERWDTLADEDTRRTFFFQSRSPASRGILSALAYLRRPGVSWRPTITRSRWFSHPASGVISK